MTENLQTAYLSSISCSLLWAASTSMQELSASGRDRAAEGCEAGVRGSGFGQGCGGARSADRGGQLFAVGQSQRALLFESSTISTSASTISLLRLALHPLNKTQAPIMSNPGIGWKVNLGLSLSLSHLLIVHSPPVLPEAPCLPAAVRQMCQNRKHTSGWGQNTRG